MTHTHVNVSEHTPHLCGLSLLTIYNSAMVAQHHNKDMTSAKFILMWFRSSVSNHIDSQMPNSCKSRVKQFTYQRLLSCVSIFVALHFCTSSIIDHRSNSVVYHISLV